MLKILKKCHNIGESTIVPLNRLKCQKWRNLCHISPSLIALLYNFFPKNLWQHCLRNSPTKANDKKSTIIQWKLHKRNKEENIKIKKNNSVAENKPSLISAKKSSSVYIIYIKSKALSRAPICIISVMWGILETIQQRIEKEKN